MNKSRVIKTGAAFTAALCAAGWLMAQSDSQPYRAERPHKSDTTTSASQPMKINRASQLIGMTVKNQQDEKLGKIDDIVIDLTGERVGYVVLSVSQGVLSSDKLIAVPLKAFQPSADGTHLILNADKDKLAKAEGFDKDHWPSPSNPAWGAEPFWQEGNSQKNMPESTTPRNPSTPKNY